MIRPVGCPVASVRHHERHQLGRISTRTGCVRNHRLEAVLRGVADIRREAVQARTLAMRVGAAADERLLDVGGPESFRLCVSAQDGVRAVSKKYTHNRSNSPVGGKLVPPQALLSFEPLQAVWTRQPVSGSQLISSPFRD